MDVFRRVAILTMAAVNAMNVTLWMIAPDQRPRVIVSLLSVNGVALLGLAINRQRKPTLASALFVCGLIAQATALSFTGGGIRSPGVTMNFVFVLMAGILLGKRWGYAAAGFCAVIGLALVALERAGHVPVTEVPFGPLPHFVVNMVYVVVTLGLVGLATDRLGFALRRAREELVQRRAAEAKREVLLGELGERVKELRLLHGAAQLLSDRPYGPEVLHDLVRLVPLAWLYPADCAARITYGSVVAASSNWRETPWRMTEHFATTNGTLGAVDVVYLEERPAAEEGPFLREERELLISLAEMCRAYLDRHEAEERRLATEHQLRQSQKMEALGTLAGGIAHDFNNILTAIIGNVALAKLDTETSHPAHESLEMIEQAAERAADIVRRILLFGRRQESERKPVALGRVLEEAAELVRSAATNSVTIETEAAPDLPPVVGDASQLYQVILNLGTNGLHAMRTRGGILRLQLQTIMIDEADARFHAALMPGPHVLLSVADTGTGMSEETRRRIFEPFFTTKGQEGTGLGLAVVHGIVQDHGGAILVESEVGRGTTMRVYLPIGTAVAPAGELPRGTGQHVMYVDDEETLVHMMRRAVERLGYLCTGHTDPRTALEQFRETPDAFAAVLTDYSMPGITGIELARTMRAIRPHLRIALVSGHWPRNAPTADQMTVHVAKPVSMHDLAMTLAKLVDAPDRDRADGAA